MTCQAEISSYFKGAWFEKDSLQVIKFLGSSLREFTVLDAKTGCFALSLCEFFSEFASQC